MSGVAWLWLLGAVCAGGALLSNEDRGVPIPLVLFVLALLLGCVAMFAKEATR